MDKICPFMSKSSSEIYCTKKCALAVIRSGECVCSIKETFKSIEIISEDVHEMHPQFFWQSFLSTVGAIVIFCFTAAIKAFVR